MTEFVVEARTFTNNQIGTWLFENVGKNNEGWKFTSFDKGPFTFFRVTIDDDMLALQFKLRFAEYLLNTNLS